MNKEEQKIVATGKEMWEKKLKKLKLTFSNSDVSRLARKLKYINNSSFFRAISQGNINIDEILASKEESQTEEQESAIDFEKFANIARSDAGGILVDGKRSGILYSYAKCCNPIPGDPVIGYITVGEGIKIHRKTCNNLINLSRSDASKLVPVEWPATDGSLFVAGVSVKGEDSPGILNDIAHTIVTYRNTNIKSININTNDSTFEGNVSLYVNNLEHLKMLIERLKKLQGIYKVERFESA